jgi:predicted RNase H-like nuclease
MANIVGVDGCPAGWIALIENIETRRITAHVFLTFGDLAVARDAAVIAIDIPIGLTESGPRDCDLLARHNLGPKRGSSVFPAPVRAALSASTDVSAKAASTAAQKKGISKQAFAIYAKIREVDEALRSDADLRSRVFEVHPELTFSTWDTVRLSLRKEHGRDRRPAARSSMLISARTPSTSRATRSIGNLRRTTTSQTPSPPSGLHNGSFAETAVAFRRIRHSTATGYQCEWFTRSLTPSSARSVGIRRATTPLWDP